MHLNNLAHTIFGKLQQFASDILVIEISIPAVILMVSGFEAGVYFIFIVIAGIALAQNFINRFATVATKLFFVQRNRHRPTILTAVVA